MIYCMNESVSVQAIAGPQFFLQTLRLFRDAQRPVGNIQM